MIIAKASSASSSFFHVIDADRIALTGLRAPDVTSEADIEFTDVTFAYPTRPGVKVLNKFNARFEKGKTTALVGPSGSGKSTIVGLIERWYQLEDSCEKKEINESGAISVDGQNINALDLKWWRSQIGLVQQEPFLFNDTIYNNVAFGLIGTALDKEPDSVKADLVRSACREAFAEEFIEKLPQVRSNLMLSLLRWMLKLMVSFRDTRRVLAKTVSN